MGPRLLLQQTSIAFPSPLRCHVLARPFDLEVSRRIPAVKRYPLIFSATPTCCHDNRGSETRYESRAVRSKAESGSGLAYRNLEKSPVKRRKRSHDPRAAVDGIATMTLSRCSQRPLCHVLSSNFAAWCAVLLAKSYLARLCLAYYGRPCFPNIRRTEQA
ncbi:hypothetical protein GGR56DRAFT_643265 [Xylariaceae sp. FL0804]|nr:hypothetical protein GGR56DRAFT_643265 [Xylariaceae sp. FL0804]